MYDRLYPSRYERNEGGNNKVLVTVWLEVKDELRLIGIMWLLDIKSDHVTMALQASH